MKYLKSIFVSAVVACIVFSCKKDRDFDTQSKEKPDAMLLVGAGGSNPDFDEYEAAFYLKKYASVSNSFSLANPLSFELDMSSAYYTEYFGTPGIIVNTLGSPFEDLQYIKPQVLIKKTMQDSFEFRTLLYIADSTFYMEKSYKPLMINFTGNVVECTDSEMVENIYNFYLGGVIGTNPDVQALEIEVEIWPDCWPFNIVRCPSAAGGGSGGGGFWGSIGAFFSGGSNGGGTNGGGGSWNSSGWGNSWTNPGSNSGSGSGGGGGGSLPDLCENQSDFWSQYDFDVKINYLEALSDLMHTLNISACNDPFGPIDPCTITYTEILCKAAGAGCFSTTNPTEGDFTICLTPILAPEANYPPLTEECFIKAETFLIANELSMTPEELMFLTNAYGMCSSNQNSFNNYVCDELPIHLLNQFSVKYGIHISNSQAQTIFSEVNTCNGTEYEEQVLGILLEPLQLNNEQIGFLMNNPVVVSVAIPFLNDEGWSEEAKEDAHEYVSLLFSLTFPQDPSAYEQLVAYIRAVRNLCTNRCTDYGTHADFLDNWLYAVDNDPNVTTVEVYDMALWAKGLRDKIIANHLLQFGLNVLDVLEVAAWAYDLQVAQRFFSAVPPSARNWGMSRMVTRLSTPISSFSAWQYAQKFGINSYDDLVKIFNDLGWSRAQKGVQFHHLIEQRFAGKPGMNAWLGNSTGEWKSVVLKAAGEHPAITTAWRQKIPYITDTPGPGGLNTVTATIDDIKQAASEIYQDFPEILQALGL